MRKQLILLIFLSYASNVVAQDGFTLGLFGATINQDPLVQWSEDFTQISRLAEPLEVPTSTIGYSIGYEYYTEAGFNLGIGWVRSRRETVSDDINLFGEMVERKLRIKFNHIEMPFFYFPGNGLVGFGTAIDAGKHKVRVFETDNGEVTPLTDWQLGYKAGLKFRTGKEGIFATAFLYYQDGFIPGDLQFGNQEYEYLPTAIGLRFSMVIGLQ